MPHPLWNVACAHCLCSPFDLLSALCSLAPAPVAACSHGEWRAAPSRGLVRATQYHQQQLAIEATRTENIFCIKLKQGNLSWDLAASDAGVLMLSDFFAPADVSVRFNAARGARRIFIEFQPESLKRHGGWVEEGYTFFIGRRKGTTVQQSPAAGHRVSPEDDETQMEESSSSSSSSTTKKRGRSAAVAKERQEGKRRRVISKGNTNNTKRGSGKTKAPAHNSAYEDDEKEEEEEDNEHEDDIGEDKCDDDHGNAKGKGKGKVKGKAKAAVMDSDYEEDEHGHDEDPTDEEDPPSLDH